MSELFVPTRDEFAKFVREHATSKVEQAEPKEGILRQGEWDVREWAGFVPVRSIVFDVGLDLRELLHGDDPEEGLVHGGTRHDVSVFYDQDDARLLNISASYDGFTGIVGEDEAHPLQNDTAAAIAGKVMRQFTESQARGVIVPRTSITTIC